LICRCRSGQLGTVSGWKVWYPPGLIRMERKLAQPGFWKATLLVLLAMGVQIALSIPLGILDAVVELALHEPPPHLGRQPLVIGFINLAAFAGPIALGLHWNRLSFRRAFPIRRVTGSQVAGLIPMMLGGGIVLSEIDNAFRVVVPVPAFVQDLFNDVFFDEGKFLSRAFLMVIVAPVTEELLFRGLLLRGMLSRHRPAVAVLLSAFLFAAIHLNPWQFLSALFLGVLFGWIYLRTAFVGFCVAGHALANGLCLVIPRLPVDIPGLTSAPYNTPATFQPWWLDLTGLVLLLSGLWIFRRATGSPETEERPAPPVLAATSD
jgi:uncharacterized protein